MKPNILPIAAITLGLLEVLDSVHVPDANKTSTGFRGDPTKQYGDWH